MRSGCAVDWECGWELAVASHVRHGSARQVAGLSFSATSLCGEQGGSDLGQVALRRPRSAADRAPGLPRASARLGQSAAWAALAGPISRLGRAGRPHRLWFPHGDEQRRQEDRRVPVGDRLEVDDHRLVDGERVCPAAADGLQRRRVREPPHAAGRLRAQRREAWLGGRGGAGWPRPSWGGMPIAGAWQKARWPGDGSARSWLWERGSGGQAANRRLASGSGLCAVRLGRVNGGLRAMRLLGRASNRLRAV